MNDKLKNLMDERDKLIREIEEHEQPVVFDSTIGDEDAEADEAEEYENKMSIAQALKERLEEVDNEINRIRKES
jgi:RNA polymerase-binding transcription factor DksA